MLVGFVDVIVNALMKCSKPTPDTEKWVESRRYAIKALTSLSTTVGLIKQGRNIVRRYRFSVKIINIRLGSL